MTYGCRKCGKTITFEPDDPFDDIEIMMDLESWGWLLTKEYGFICPDCVKEEKTTDEEYYETGEPLGAFNYPTTFNIQVQAGTWEFGDGEITFTHNDGTVDTIYKNGILYGKEKRRKK